jgi:hypothetical protein
LECPPGFQVTSGIQPGYQVELEWVREESGGNWYRIKGQTDEGWLCPSLFKYFEAAPERIFVKAEKL